jgi:hypothetical protein
MLNLYRCRNSFARLACTRQFLRVTGDLPEQRDPKTHAQNDRDLIDTRLAHAVRDPNGRAYNRTAHLPERRKMMQVWAGLSRRAKGRRTKAQSRQGFDRLLKCGSASVILR